MAFSAASVEQSVFGNKRMVSFILTADANSGAVATGLSIIDAVSVTPKSCATTAPKFKINLSAASAAANGSLFGSSCTSGDEFYVVAYGK